MNILEEFKQQVTQSYVTSRISTEIYSFLEFAGTETVLNEITLDRIRHLTKEDVTNYVRWLYNKKHLESKINIKLKALKILCVWLYRHKLLSHEEIKNIYTVVKPLKISKKKYLYIGDIDRIVKKIFMYSKMLKNNEDIYYIKMILYFLFYTGMSVKEVKKLRRTNIDLQKKLVKLHNRVIPIPDSVVELIRIYFNREPELQNAFNWNRSTSRIINNGLRRYRIRKGFVTLKWIRESYVNMLNKKGIDIRFVQYLLGLKGINGPLLKDYNVDYRKLIPMYRNRVTNKKGDISE